MERPYEGIANIDQTPNGYQITIPAKKHIPVIMFLSFWLVAWFVGVNFVGSPFLGDFYDNGNGGSGFDNLFSIVWLVLWIPGGLFVMKTLMWYLIGKEIILIDREQVSITRKNDIFFRTRIYDLKEAKNFHVEEEPFEFAFWGRRNDLSLFKNRGSIRFEYGFKTIRFANDMDQAEANHILERLKSSGYLNSTNFN
ncbi:hypothetical protein [Sphingobacterium sp.]|uniref:hypothetical protein n=1 Tax=Sphingobacterium sp. TaxID=341027 RepID=UPI0028994719|nr:hypothetical protein [Sphingobacterium sp.]